MITVGTNGYITCEQFEDWANARLIDFTAYSTLQIEAAIVTASLDFLDVSYTFKGCKIDDGQAMSLPTDEVAIADITNAVCQATWQQLQGYLFKDQSTATGEVIMKREKVGQLEEETQYAEGSTPTFLYSTTQINRLLKPYITGGAGGLGLMRG